MDIKANLKNKKEKGQLVGKVVVFFSSSKKDNMIKILLPPKCSK